MNFDNIPIWILFVGMTLVVMVFIEAGYRLGCLSHQRSEDEKESPVSAIAGTILGLVAFMLAFTFGIVSNRYDARKELVREEANTIGTTYLRADFLPEPDRTESKQLLKDYLNERLNAILALQSGKKFSQTESQEALSAAQRMQSQLWNIAVTNARKNMDSDVAALYIDSLNSLIDIHAIRVAVGLQARIPGGIWLVLGSLTFFGMASVGYQSGIAGSKRSMAKPVLAICFSMVIALITALDRPHSGYIRVSQQPLIDLRNSME